MKEIVSNRELRQTLSEVGVGALRKVFPSFNVQDTTRTLKNGREVHVPDLSQTVVLEVSEQADPSSLSDRFSKRENVLYAEPNHRYSTDVGPLSLVSDGRFPSDLIQGALFIPSDPLYDDQWSLERPDDEDIDAEAAWNTQPGSYGVKIGILDSGVDYQHPDLGNGLGPAEKISGGYDYFAGDNDPMDENYHGTHVAGIAGALTNNTNSNGQSEGVAGVAGGNGYDATSDTGNKGAQLYAFRIAGPAGGVSAAAAAQAIVEAADSPYNGGYDVDVLNNSWGGDSYNETVRSALNHATLLKSVVVASKGNGNTDDLHFPSDYDDDWVISVGATNKEGDRAENPDPGWEAGKGSNYGNGIDLVAPGTAIVSTMPTSRTSFMIQTGLPPDYGGGENYSGPAISGTSFSAPHVSGTAALLLSEAEEQGLSLHPEDVEQLLKVSAEFRDDYTKKKYGEGRLNADRALQRLYDPWSFEQAAATGGSSVTSTDKNTRTVFDSGTGDLDAGFYAMKRYAVERTVSLPSSYSEIPDVWCRGANASTGWSRANPKYQTGYCRVISVDYTTATLRSYVFEVWTINEQYLGWYPSKPSNVTFAYSVSGKAGPPPLQVSISGPSSLDSQEQGTWTTSISGGTGSISYDWESKDPGVGSTWQNTQSCSGSSCTIAFFNGGDYAQNAGLRAIVTKGAETDTATAYAMIYPSGSGCGTPPCTFPTRAKPQISLKTAPAPDHGQGHVQLAWTVRGAVPSSPFSVQHRADSTASWSTLAAVEVADSVQVDTASVPSYRYVATGLPVGTHQFRIGVSPAEGGAASTAGRDGNPSAKKSPGMQYSSSVTTTVSLEGAYRLAAFPNPVRQQATVELAVKERQDVTVSVYDVLGRRVATLHEGALPAQEIRRFQLNSVNAGLTSGSYFVRVTGEDFAATERLTVVR